MMLELTMFPILLVTEAIFFLELKMARAES
jgi:hypothetical protein